MNRFFERFSLSAIILLAVGFALLAALILQSSFRISQAHVEMERGAQEQATAALDMLESVHTSAMLLRKNSADNDPAIDTLNLSMEQFSRQNQNIKLWLVMAPLVLKYQRANNQTEIEGPRDSIDTKALQKRASQQEFTQKGTFRITRPVIMGKGSAAKARCAECHKVLMGIVDGEVIGAYSAEVNMTAPMATWRASAIESTLAGIIVTLLTLGLILFLLHRTVLTPVTKLANIADQIAGGVADIEFAGAERRDALGVLARSLNAFKLKAREQLTLEVETARKNEALRKADELREARDQLEHIAYFDALTGLANRAHCQKDMAEKFSSENSNKKFAIIQIDLDNFKRVNDTLGHAAGDHLLRTLGERMNLLVSEFDNFKSYRWGGDEFIALVERDEDTDLDAICAELTDMIAIPLKYEKATLRPTVSLGIARYPEDARDLKSLMIFSDLALYRTKDLGRDGYQFFTSEMKEKIDSESQIEHELHIALENNQFELFFQPQLNIKDESITGIEALIRWNHPEKGLIGPNEFLAITETAGLASSIGCEVFELAMKAARSWIDDGLEFGRLAMNLSPEHIKTNTILEDFFGKMGDYDIDPRFLAVEFLESYIFDDTDTDIMNILSSFRARNIHVELDDFGTGYASLSHLSSLPINGLKIDKSFIDKMGSDNRQQSIVSTLISMSKMIELRVVCEGIETRKQLEAIAQIGDCSIQGYLVSRPMSFEKMTDWIRQKRNLGILNTEQKAALKQRNSGTRST